MKLFLISLVLTATNTLVIDLLRTEEQRKTFHKALELSRKTVHTTAEENFRKQIFLQNLRLIEEYNSEGHSNTLEANQFSVMTAEEQQAVLIKNRGHFQAELRKTNPELFDENPKTTNSALSTILNNVLNDSSKKVHLASGSTTLQEFEDFWIQQIENFINAMNTGFTKLYTDKFEECISVQQSELSSCIRSAKSELRQTKSSYSGDKNDLRRDIRDDYSTLRRTISDLRPLYRELIQELNSQFRSTRNEINSAYREFKNDVENSWTDPGDPNDPANAFSEGTLFYNMREQNKLSVDWEADGKVTPVRDQGACGSCWAFSVTAAIESQILVDNLTERDLAEQQPLDCTFEQSYPNHDACDGGLGYMALQSIQSTGIPLETDLPYTATDNACQAIPGAATRFDITGVHWLSQSNNMQLLLEELYLHPIAVAFHVSNYFQYNAEGIIDCKNTSYYNGQSNNHEVLAVGYEINEANPELSFIRFKNQWGSNWGEDGYFRFKLYNEINTAGPCGLTVEKSDTTWVTLDAGNPN